MKISTYLSVVGIVAIAFGVVFLLVPGATLPLYGFPTDAHNVLQARFFGSALAGLGVVVYMGRAVRDDAALKALLQGSAATNITGLLVALYGVLTGLNSALGWSTVAIYGLFFAGAVYFLRSPARRA